MDQKPSIGRIVYYHDGGEFEPYPRPMIITDVHSDTCVSGVVFRNLTPHTEPKSSVMYGTELNHWSWPPRV